MYTPKEFENIRFSPTYYTNYLHYIKKSPVDTTTIIYGNTGAYYDLQCLTHSSTILTDSKSIKAHPGEDHNYELLVDVSKEPLNKEFIVVVRGILWNSFNDTTKNDASTYTDNSDIELDELALMVIFPQKKPFKSIPEKKEWPTIDDNNVKDYRGLENYYADVNHSFIFWDIQGHQPNHHYQLRWDW